MNGREATGTVPARWPVRRIDQSAMSPHLLPEDLLAHAASMRRLARGLVLDEGQAEDVVQEAFVAVAERRPSRPRSLAGWARGMVRNLVRYGGREERRRRRRERLVARPEVCPPTHVEMVERAELERAVVDGVLALPEPYRATILARYFNEMQAAEIAARDGVPVATVRTRIQRGLERLRRALDEKHGGDRDRWRPVLFPLATAGLVAGSTGAAASTQAAAGAGASGATKVFILGGALMTQKTIALAAAATLLGLAAGLGVGRLTTPMTKEEARERFGLVDAARVRDLEARLEDAMREAADSAWARDEAAVLASRLEALGGDLEKARGEAASAGPPAPPSALAVSFGKFADLEALKEADWPELARALREMNGLFLESIDTLDRGEPVDPETTARLAAGTAILSKFSLELMGKIPTNAAFNGEWTHPLVASNLMGAMLEAAGAPLSAAQKDAIARLGNEYELRHEERQASYSDATPVLEKMLDELELKRGCLEEVRSQLTPEQRDETAPAILRDRLQHDCLSPGTSAFFLVKTTSYRSAAAAREQFQRSTIDGLGLTDEQAAALSPAFDAWHEAVKPLLEPEKPTSLSPTLEAALQAGRAQQALYQRILELPGLDASTRQKLLAEQQWTLPRVSEGD
jgi:RNA polymerase sigma factor (sigma-70 family)